MEIPKNYHRFILGRSGEILKKIELETATSIKVPDRDSKSTTIVIKGAAEGLQQARNEIQTIADKQVSFHLVLLDRCLCFKPTINIIINLLYVNLL